MTLNAALVGVGKWGQRLVKATQDQSPSLRFTRGVTRTVSKAAAFCQRQGMALTDDLDAMLADKSVDMVVMATPHSVHEDLITRTVQAGKHCFVIKPLTQSLKTAKAVSKAADKAGVKLGVGFPWRHFPATKELKRLATSGELGILSHCESNYCVPRFMSFKPDDWKATPEEHPPGALITHSVDVLTDLFGPMESLSVVSMNRVVPWKIHDVTSLLCRFKNGASGYVGSSGCTGPIVRLTVYGSKGWAEVRDETRLEFQPASGESTVTEYPTGEDETLKWELESFADWIAGKDSYPWSREHDLHGVAVSDAVVKAAKTGRAVKVAA
jgi:predicted dehydrogenase